MSVSSPHRRNKLTSSSAAATGTVTVAGTGTGSGTGSGPGSGSPHQATNSISASGGSGSGSGASHKKEKDKKHKYEDIPTPVPVGAPLITSPFDRLDQVWALPTPDKQRELIGQLFGLLDGPRMSLQAISLDHAFQHLKFAHDSGFSVDQTRVFYALVTQLRAVQSSPCATLPTVYAAFRTYMLQHAHIVRDESERTDPVTQASIAATNAVIQSFVIPPKYQQPAQVLVIQHDGNGSGTSGHEDDATRPPTAAATAIAAANSCDRDRPTSPSPVPGSVAGPPSKPTLTKQKSSVAKPKRVSPAPSMKRPSSRNRNMVEEDDTPAPPPPPKLLVGMFTTSQIQLITQYFTNGMFGHFELYQAVFNPNLFQPTTRTISEPIHIETVVPDRLHLSDAFDLEAEAKKRQALLEEQKLKESGAVFGASTLDPDSSRAASRADDDEAHRSANHSNSNSRSHSRTNTAKDKDKDKDGDRTRDRDRDKDKASEPRDKKSTDGTGTKSGSHKKRSGSYRESVTK